MATAAAVNMQRNDRAHVVTTSDANLTLIRCPAEIAEVLIQPTSAAGALVQVEDAAQGDAPASHAVEVIPLGTVTVRPEDCGVGAGQAWSFGVARSAAGAVIKINGVAR